MGCTLNYTAEDHSQMRTSFQAQCRTSKTDMPRDTSSSERRVRIRSAMQRASSKTLVSILSDKSHKAYNPIANLLSKSIGCNLKIIEEQKVPEALSVILKDHPDAMGIFEKVPSHRGPGASAVSHHYEITSVAALKQATFKSLSGKNLTISPGDRVDFGVKFAKGYTQPKRYGTIEADTFVSQGEDLISEKTIAIDQKYSQAGKRGVPNQTDFSRQLDGIRTGLQDGKIEEFYFVTNGIFDNRFKDMVKEENLRIAKDYAENINWLHKDFDRQDLTPKEKETIPEGKMDLNVFEKDNNIVREFVTKHDIPQIELCENVVFNGS